MQLQEILPKLTAWFPPEDHKERKLPGGGRWFYVPHQAITRHLNEVCPGEWHSKIASSNIAGDYTVILLELTICNVTRTGIGDDKTFPEINEEGKAKIIGTPPVRAFRSAFKDACEQFGICAYIDEQSSNRNAFIKFMHSKGDMRAYKYAEENGWKEAGAMGTAKQQDAAFKAVNNQSRDKTAATPTLITQSQAKRLWAIARNELNLSEDRVKTAQQYFGFEKTELITLEKYESLIKHLRSLAAAANTKPATQDLYPVNNDIIRQVRSYTKHEPDWIFAQCKQHGYDRPGMMPTNEIEKLVIDMCVDWALRVKALAQVEQARTSIQGALAFAKGAGRPILEAAIEWLNRHQSVVTSGQSSSVAGGIW